VSSAVMKHELGRAQNHALPTLEGYTLLLGAVAMMHQSSPHDFDRPRQMLEHLILRSNRHPVPLAWLANWYVLKINRGLSNDAESDTSKALDAAGRALDLEPSNPLALTIDGFVHTNLRKDIALGQRRYEAAIEANPNESLAWLLKGTMHAFRGEGDVAVKNTAHAIKLSPLDPLKYYYDSLAATAALAAKDYLNAITLAKKSLRANRMHSSTLRVLAIAYVELGFIDLARDVMTDLLTLEPSLTVSQYVARNPSGSFTTGLAWSGALKIAGLPQ
jgi:adenylate cyclase